MDTSTCGGSVILYAAGKFCNELESSIALSLARLFMVVVILWFGSAHSRTTSSQMYREFPHV
jgi:hypothetical protein